MHRACSDMLGNHGERSRQLRADARVQGQGEDTLRDARRAQTRTTGITRDDNHML